MGKRVKGIRKVFTGLNEYYVYDLDADVFGKRKRIYAKSESEIKEKIMKEQQERQALVACYKPTSTLLAEYVKFYFRNAIGLIAINDMKRLVALFEKIVYTSEINKDISTITEEEIQKFLNLLSDKFPQKTIEKIYEVLRKTFEISNEEKVSLLDFNNIVLPKNNYKVAYILEPKEFDELLNFCIADNCTRYKKNTQFIIMSMFTGLKFSAIKKLQTKHINLKDKTIVIDCFIKVNLPEGCVNWLIEQVNNNLLPDLDKDDESTVFTNMKGVSPTLQSIQTTLLSVTNRLALPKGITGTTLCKSHVIWTIKNGEDINTVCQRLGCNNSTINKIIDEYEVRRNLF